MKAKISFLAIVILTIQLVLCPATSFAGTVQSSQQIVSVPFNTENWTVYTNNNKQGYPCLSGDTATLIPDDTYGAVTSLWYKQEITLPLSVEFEFSTWDNDGGSIWNSADGIAFMFCKNTGAYNNSSMPGGNNLGFIPDNTGYGVKFNTYGKRCISLVNGAGQSLKSVSMSSIYTNRDFKKVKITVDTGIVKVWYDNNLIITWEGTIDTAYKSIGLSSATGAADSEHKIRNVKVSTGGTSEMQLIIKKANDQISSASLDAGKTMTVKAWAVYSDGKTKNVTNQVTFTNSTPSAATVKSGLIKGIAEGETIITANWNGLSAELKITVNKVVKKIDTSSTKITLKVGASSAVGVTAQYTGASNSIVTPDCTYTSSNSSVASVSRSGEIKGVSKGTAVITASYGSKKVKINVKVEADKGKK